MAYDLGTARGVIEMDYNGRGVKQAQTDLTGLEGKGISATKALGAIGKAVGITTFVAAVGGAINTMANFEQKISNIEAVSGATGDELDSLREKALQLGADTAFSASEAAGAMEELVKAGLSVDEVLNGAADAAVALAAAGGIDIPQAATIASNALNQFNLEATELTGVVDSIAGAANASAIDVSQLGQSLTQVGAVANLAGLSFEDTATAIALMGNAGIVGSDAGTSLKTMLQNLQPVTTKQIALFKELGIVTEDGKNQFFDAQGNIKSYADISGVLANALKGQTNQQKLLTLETMFGTDAIRAAATAADAGRKGVNALNKEMNETSAAEVAAKRMDNFKGSLDQLVGSIETAIIIGGSGLLPVLRDVVDWLTEAVNSAVEAGQALAQEVSPGFIDLVDAVGNLVDVGIGVVGMFDDLGGSVAKLGLGVVIGLFNALASILESVTSLLDGQEAIVAIAVGTWILLANGGIGLVIQRLGWFVAMAATSVAEGFTAITTGAASSGAALKGLAASAAAATASLAAVAVLVAAVMVWNAYKQAVEETEAALGGVKEAKESGTLKALADESKAVKKLIADRREAMKEFDAGWSFGAKGWKDVGKAFNNAFNPTRWDDVTKATFEYKDSISELEAGVADAENTMHDMGAGVTRIAQSLGMLDIQEAQGLMDALASDDPADAIERLDGLITQFEPLLNEAGISSKEFVEALQGTGDVSLGQIQSALDSVTGKAKGARGATVSLTEAAKDFGNEAMTAADKAKALNDALDALIGVEVDADQAAIKWREGLRELASQIDRTSGKLFAQTKVGDENRSLVIDQVEALNDRIVAEAKSGTSIGKLTKMMKDGRQAIIDTTGKTKEQREEVAELLGTYNLTPEAVRTLIEAVGVERAKSATQDLIDQYGFTPKEVKTIFEAAGAKTAKEQVEALRKKIKELRGKEAPVTTPGSVDAKVQVQELREQIKELKPKAAEINTPGAVQAKAEIERLKAAIDALKDKNITITTYIQRFIRNAAKDVGGDLTTDKPTTDGRERTLVTDGMLDPRFDSPSAPTGLAPVPRSTGGTDSKRLRLVSGELALDESGRAFIRGIAVDAVESDASFDAGLERAGISR